jgi:hypothetical protein
MRLKKSAISLLITLAHVQFRASRVATTPGRRAEKSGPLLEFNVLGRLAIVLTLVFVQLPMRMRL